MNQATLQSNPPRTNEQPKYFDLHTEGLGYLNRIRVVPVKKGEGYLCCAISALRGSADEPEYTYFDLKVTGTGAKSAIGILRTAVDNDEKVLVGFKAGDTYPEVFTYENGPKKGQTGVSTKGRLLKLRWARIEGVPVDLPGEEGAEVCATNATVAPKPSTTGDAAAVPQGSARDHAPAQPRALETAGMRG